MWFCSFCLQRIFPFNHISDDTEFLLAIGDRVDYHALNFIPFFDNENRYLLNPEDLDPDINYYNNISLPDTFVALFVLSQLNPINVEFFVTAV